MNEAREIVDHSTVDHYRRGMYRLTTIVPLAGRPERKTYELTQDELADFLESYGDYAEFIVELTRYGDVTTPAQ